MEIIFSIFLVIHLLFTVIVIYNFLSNLNLKSEKKFNDPIKEKISVLIPFRNEERNVNECLEKVLTQHLENFEVICLNDNSTDKTLECLKDFESKFKIIKVINGEPLPKGWIGKNWACHQLAKFSSGEYLVFLDADVRINPKAVKSAINYMKLYHLKLLSVFPTQIMKSISDFLIIPSMNWLLLTFLPMKLIYKSMHQSLVAANGQFIVFQRDSYFLLGGHQSVKNQIVEDMAIARMYKKNKLRIATLLGGKIIYARMYETLKEAIEGFTKNFFAGFKVSSVKFSFILVGIFVLFCLPYLLVFFHLKYFVIVGIILFQKLIVSKVSKQNIIINIFLSPVQFLIVVYIGLRSLIFTNKGKIIWKGRKINSINT